MFNIGHLITWPFYSLGYPIVFHRCIRKMIFLPSTYLFYICSLFCDTESPSWFCLQLKLIEAVLRCCPFISAEGNCNGVECDTHAQCVQPLDDGPPQCECEKGWEGNGQTCVGNTNIHVFIRLICFKWRYSLSSLARLVWSCVTINI